MNDSPSIATLMELLGLKPKKLYLIATSYALNLDIFIYYKFHYTQFC